LHGLARRSNSYHGSWNAFRTLLSCLLRRVDGEDVEDEGGDEGGDSQSPHVSIVKRDEN